jgi:hypothetical protein
VLFLLFNPGMDFGSDCGWEPVVFWAQVARDVCALAKDTAEAFGAAAGSGKIPFNERGVGACRSSGKASGGFIGRAHVAQLVEHVLGKDEVSGSIPLVGSIPMGNSGMSGAVGTGCEWAALNFEDRASHTEL